MHAAWWHGSASTIISTSSPRASRKASKLLAALERAAAERHLHTVRLDTHASLAAALQLYRTSGYHAIPRFNDNPYARHWFEKALD
jgi:ribosomal protein S18 acetylase RimI-like enzyme